MVVRFDAAHVCAMAAAEPSWHGKHWIRDSKREKIIRRSGYRCAYCDCDLRDLPPGEVVLDHVVPRHWFLVSWLRIDNSERNLVAACKHCNDSRRDRPVEDFASAEALARIRLLLTLPLGEEAV